ncbi:hypothetical protein F4780DRAFT_723515 [Xylariomycetidae sp. FL0641]|nr:hypothetical protein F4780DRAFT_723515 [Xylariomycetidae sp. FL0641]
MTEVVPADRTPLLQSKRAECSAIARSRKRKLCILYEVAVSPDNLPKRSFADPDAPPTSTAEQQFLESCDILQGRRLNELNIPARPRPQPGYVLPRPSTQNITSTSNKNVPLSSDKWEAVGGSRLSVLPSPAPSRPSITVDQTKPVPQPAGHGAVQPPNTASIPAKSPNPSAPSHGRTFGKPTSEETGKDSPKDGKPPTPVAAPKPSSAAPPSASPNGPPPDRQGLERQFNLHPAGQQTQHQGPDTVPMDIDAPAARKPDMIRTSTPQSFHQDTARPSDALSSPGSTAQTATTPVVLDTSANTSPDRDGMPSISQPVEKTGSLDRQVRQPPHFGLSGHVTGPESRQTMISDSIPRQVEAQLLRDSSRVIAAKATDSSGEKATTESGPVSRPAEGPLRVTTSSPTTERKDKASVMHRPSPLKPTPDASVRAITPVTGSSAHLARPSEDLLLEKVPFSKNTGTSAAVSSQETPRSPANLVEKSKAPDVEVHSSLPTPALHEVGNAIKEGVSDVALQKPVSEILSEPPKSSASESSMALDKALQAAPITPTSQSSKARSQTLLRKAKTQERSKLSTVVFGKPNHQPEPAQSLVQNRTKASPILSDDYFTPLFVHTFATSSKWMKPLDQILHQANKTVSTPDSYTQILDNQACRVLRRVYHLQHSDKWSLRQPKRCPEPARQACHWDVLLKEMKWMRTDFREERKWKMAAARNLAHACAEWVAASREERKELQVNAIVPPRASLGLDDAKMTDSHVRGPEDNPTPDLVPSAESDSPLELDDEPAEHVFGTVPPSAIFALPEDDIVFALQPSPNTDRLLEELPMYGSPLKVPKSDLIAPDFDPDASWKKPAVPLSKYVTGEMHLTASEPPRKRSRYHYVQEDEEEDEVIFGHDGGTQPRLEPENPEVALFRPENKSIRDRLHAGHQFRPPNEYTMPFQTFYESRSPSQWTQAEDDELKSLVREYSYNWSLIASILASKSMFGSAAERRTPWECFERWVMLEGLPHDMQKTQYFKLWQNRIESATSLIRQQNHTALQQQAQQQQQAGANGPVAPLPRRRMSLPLRVERRRNQKHLTMIDAMRKLAKKRETALQKQQHAAHLAAMRKASEPPQPKPPTKTPREYSIMRWERDQAMAEKLAERMAQQQRHEAQRRVRNPAAAAMPGKADLRPQAAMQRAQQGQVAHLAAAQNAGQLPQSTPQMAASHPHANMSRANAPNQISINGQGRPRMPMHSSPNATPSQNHVTGALVPPLQMSGSPQVQMAAVNGQSRMAMPNGQPDLQLLMQAQQISEQQRRSVQMRQQQQQQQQQQAHPNHQGGSTPLQNSPPAMKAAALNGLNQKNYMSNAQTMMTFNGTSGSGMSTPPAAGLNMSPGQAGSPRPTAILPPQPNQTYLSQLQQIENHIRQANPDTPQQQVRDYARNILQSRHSAAAQSAMNAAAGGPGQTAIANGPHQYAQLLRAQQQQQAAQYQQQQAQAQAQAHAQAQAQAHAQAQAQAQAAQAQAQAQAAQQNAQHQRQSSGSATPTPSIPK